MELRDVLRRTGVMAIQVIGLGSVATEESVEETIPALGCSFGGIVGGKGRVVLEELVFELDEERLVVLFVFRVIGADLRARQRRGG
jgi:hypothetical protein